MSFITKKLEEFDERFSWRKAFLKVIMRKDVKDWLNEINDKRDKEIKSFLSTALDEMIKEVGKLFIKPERVVKKKPGRPKKERPYSMKITKVRMFTEDQIKQSLSSLREGNK